MGEGLKYVSFNLAFSSICVVFMIASVASVIGVFIYLKHPNSFKTVNFKILKVMILIIGVLLAVFSLVSMICVSIALRFVSKIKPQVDDTREALLSFDQTMTDTSRNIDTLYNMAPDPKKKDLDPLIEKFEAAVASARKPVRHGLEVTETFTSNQMSGMVLAVCLCIFTVISFIICVGDIYVVQWGPKFLHMPVWINAIVLMLLWWWIAIFLMPVVVDLLRACCNPVRTASGYIRHLPRDEILYFLLCQNHTLKPTSLNTLHTTLQKIKDADFSKIIPDGTQKSQAEKYDPAFKQVDKLKFKELIDCRWSAGIMKCFQEALCGGTTYGFLVTSISAFLFGILSAVYVILNLILQKRGCTCIADEMMEDVVKVPSPRRGGKAPAVAKAAKASKDAPAAASGDNTKPGDAGDAPVDESPKDVETKADEEPSDGQTMFFHEDIPPGLTPKPWKKRVTFEFACSVSYQYG